MALLSLRDQAVCCGAPLRDQAVCQCSGVVGVCIQW